MLGGPAGLEEDAMSGFAAEVVTNLYSVQRSSFYAGSAGWMVPLPGAPVGALGPGLTAMAFAQGSEAAVAPAVMAQLLAAWRYGGEGVVQPRLGSSLKTLLANMKATAAL